MPLASAQLGPERFGLWMLMGSVSAMMTFADFGIGNGMMTLIASTSGSDDRNAIRRVVGSAGLTLIALGLLVAIFALVAAKSVEWPSVLAVRSPLARSEATRAMTFFLLSLAAGIPLGIASKVQMGLQKGYIANAWQALGSLLSLATLLIALHFDAGVPSMVVALFAVPQIAMIGNLVQFGLTERDLLPSWRDIEWSTLRKMASLSFGFFALQLIAAITYRVDALIIAHFFGAAEAGIYAVYERVFAGIAMLASIALTPLWPAYSEALTRGDYQWIRQTLIVSICGVALVVGAASVSLAMIGPHIMEFYLNKRMPIVPSILIGFAVWKVIEAVGMAGTMFLNGAGILRPQVIVAVVLGICAFALKILLIRKVGSWSVVWSTIACYILIVIIPLGRIILNKLQALSGLIVEGGAVRD
ncbi:lipopolysaccharide biosynthesis protein [Parablastomonas sp. CN1-191]|uniref:lipopolysaccharide biosynthesis protein n=1 Tax=Parablastomonas sp. CN1-191 TaxID=3400908 RepID=UPI003BF8CD1A